MRDSPHGHRTLYSVLGFGVNVHVRNAQTREIVVLAICLLLGLRLRGCLLHGPWSCPMSKGIFPKVIIHGNTSMIPFLENVFLKPLNPWLGVNQTWTKRSDHAPKSGCAVFFNICSKRVVLRIFFMFDLLCFLFPSLLVTMKNDWPKKNVNFFFWMAFFCHGPLTFLVREPLLPLPLQNMSKHDNG